MSSWLASWTYCISPPGHNLKHLPYTTYQPTPQGFIHTYIHNPNPNPYHVSCISKTNILNVPFHSVSFRLFRFPCANPIIYSSAEYRIQALVPTIGGIPLSWRIWLISSTMDLSNLTYAFPAQAPMKKYPTWNQGPVDSLQLTVYSWWMMNDEWCKCKWKGNVAEKKRVIHASSIHRNRHGCRL